MPRKYHTIPITYWDEVRECGLTRNEINVDLYLLTSPNSNSIGIFRESSHTIAQYVGLGKQTVDKAMMALEAKGRLVRDQGDWLFAVKRWEYEPTKNKNTWKGARDTLRLVNRKLAREFCKRYDVDWDRLQNDSEYPSDRPSIPYRKTETETKTESETETEIETERETEKDTLIDENGEVTYLGGRSVKDIIADPKVSDTEAVSAGCENLPDKEDFLKKQARLMRTEDISKKPTE